MGLFPHLIVLARRKVKYSNKNNRLSVLFFPEIAIKFIVFLGNTNPFVLCFNNQSVLTIDGSNILLKSKFFESISIRSDRSNFPCN